MLIVYPEQDWEKEEMPLDGLQLGHYRLLRKIGSGGMGEVYLGEDVRIARQVAIKVIHTETDSSAGDHTKQEAERLFQREMKAIARLDHPHILPLYDFGEEKIENANYTYMVMPYRSEGSLSEWLRKQATGKSLSPQDVAQIIVQAADALQHAHDHQIVHQDVKPSNFLLRSSGSSSALPYLLLADFGIAKFFTATTSISQSIRGTPLYMAPEQWQGHPVAATDQYALGIMAYQLLIGRVPFSGRLEQIMHQHISVQPHPPGRINPQITPALDAVILRALAKEPEERFSSISAFARAFQQAVHATDDVSMTPAIDSEEADQAAIKPIVSSEIAHSGVTHDHLTMPNTSRATPSTIIPSTQAAFQTNHQQKSRFSTSLTRKISPKRFFPVLLVFLLILSGIIGAINIYHQQIANEYPAYLSKPVSDHGNLTITDSLSTAGEWQPRNDSSSGGSCQYTNTAYDITLPNVGVYSCNGKRDFIDFAIEVQMTIMRGDCGGITFRSNSSSSYLFRNTSPDSHYLFEVCRDGSYRLYFYPPGYDSYESSQPLLIDLSPSIQQGLHKTNTLALKTHGPSIYLYINQQLVNSTTDNSRSHGTIGFAAVVPFNFGDSLTEVAYTHARIWTL